MSMFLFFLPAMMLSGMMFPVENMPQAMQYVTALNPIRHYLVVVRAVFLKGADWWTLREPIVALFVMGGVALWVAARRFRKTVA
jgi:ABC-2 type transport system permease protein